MVWRPMSRVGELKAEYDRIAQKDVLLLSSLSSRLSSFITLTKTALYKSHKIIVIRKTYIKQNHSLCGSLSEDRKERGQREDLMFVKWHSLQRLQKKHTLGGSATD